MRPEWVWWARVLHLAQVISQHPFPSLSCSLFLALQAPCGNGGCSTSNSPVQLPIDQAESQLPLQKSLGSAVICPNSLLVTIIKKKLCYGSGWPQQFLWSRLGENFVLLVWTKVGRSIPWSWLACSQSWDLVAQEFTQAALIRGPYCSRSSASLYRFFL